MNRRTATILLLVGFIMGQLPMYFNAARIDANEFQNTGYGTLGLIVSVIIALTGRKSD